MSTSLPSENGVLYHIPHDALEEYSAVGDVGGQAVSLALHKNRHYLKAPQGADAAPYDGQFDRAALVPLRGMSEGQLDALADGAAQAANAAVLQKRLDAQKKGDDQPPGSTLLMGVYDPKSFTLRIRSAGDGYAFLVLRDNDNPENSGAIRLNNPGRKDPAEAGGKKNTNAKVLGEKKALLPENALVQYPKTRVPEGLAGSASAAPSASGFRINPKAKAPVDHDAPTPLEIVLPPALIGKELKSAENVSANPVDLAAAIAEARSRLGIGRNFTASLVFASDCMEESHDQLLGGTKESPDPHFSTLPVALHGCMKGRNPAAKGLCDLMHSYNTADNISVIAITEIEAGKGEPMAAIVCDGTNKASGMMSEAGVNGATDHLLHALEMAAPTAATAPVAATPPKAKRKGKK